MAWKTHREHADMDTITAWIVALFTALWPGADGPAGENRYFGYVEGEYVYVSAQTSGVVQSLTVIRGDSIISGQDLFTLDDDKQRYLMAREQAELAKARSQLTDESTGKRPEELEVIAEQLRSAVAIFALAKVTYERSKGLAALDFIASSQLDSDLASLHSASAIVEEQRAQLKVAQLPARTAQLEEARQAVIAAQMAVDIARVKLAERNVAAPAGGYIQQTYFLPGEYVSSGMPVVSILPEDKIKFLFYISEPDRAAIRMGAAVLIGCDNCQEPIKARISYISDAAEYTPPVIYSLEDRSKLVFMAEALPVEPTGLLPGQPIDVRLEP